jgi:hypothetical protein
MPCQPAQCEPVPVCPADGMGEGGDPFTDALNSLASGPPASDFDVGTGPAGGAEHSPATDRAVPSVGDQKDRIGTTRR